MRRFDLVENELKTGKMLIEASAGTGKTYSLTGIILRLVIEESIPIEKILVVTFTNAATAELQNRVRAGIVSLIKALTTENEPDDFLEKAIWKKYRQGNYPDAVKALTESLRSFDKAAISTIDAFCSRTLNENAFESGFVFNNELLKNESALMEETASDYWRKVMLAGDSPERFQSLKDVLRSPAYLAQTLSMLIRNDLTELGNQWQSAVAKFKMVVDQHGEDLISALSTDGNFKKANFNRTVVNNLVSFIEDLKGAEIQALLNPAYYDSANSRNLEKLIPSKIQSVALDGYSAGKESGIFAAAGTLRNLLSNRLCKFMHPEIKAFADWAIPHFNKLKKKQNLTTFRDTLQSTFDALQNSELLRIALRDKYKVALIDEFQDTDSIQLGIFLQIFDCDGHRLYCVGDPKQSIYKFRGADIDTYLRASAEASGFEKFNLTTNYRSDKGVVEAVNRLFTCNNGTADPFGGEIPFHCASVPEEKDIPKPEEKAFILREIMNQPSNADIAEAVVAETWQLVEHQKIKRFSSIAVLVNGHTQAQDVARAYVENGIPYIRKTEQSVFATDEAILLRIAMSGILGCNRISNLKAGLATPLFGRSTRYLASLDSDDDRLNEEMDTLFRYRGSWQENGFMSAFQMILSRENVRAQLLSLAGGEDSLSNYLHLAELLHDHEQRNHVSPESLLQYMVDKADEESSTGTDASRMRRTTDADAVTISTIHSSKGLEYDAVIIPFAYTGRPDEDDAENMRKLYVAVTRAKQRCIVFIAQNRNTPRTALARLLGATEKDEDLMESARAFAGNSDGWIVYQEIIRRGEPGFKAMDQIRLAVPEPPPDLAAGTITTSFSGLKHSSHAETIPDVLIEDKAVDHVDEEAVEELSSIEVAQEPAFPAGARIGRVVHGILEAIDFQRPDTLAQEIQLNLEREGFDPEMLSGELDRQINKWIRGYLDRQGTIQLSQISPSRRLNEMEFTFPLAGIHPADLSRAVRPESWRELEEGIEGIESLSGFLKGYIDMVFEHNGQFYIVDWKTNYLQGGYSQEAIRESMLHSLYTLQYLIYTVALDAYLRDRVINYDYKRHFGGIYYVYLRGFGDVPGHSVYFSKPHPDTVENLKNCLIRQKLEGVAG